MRDIEGNEIIVGIIHGTHTTQEKRDAFSANYVQQTNITINGQSRFNLEIGRSVLIYIFFFFF